MIPWVPLLVCLQLGAPPARAELVYSPTVASLLDRVTQAELEPAVRELSGETAAFIDGAEFTFSTRSSSSGIEIDMAEQYIFEQLRSYGLDSVEYHEFQAESGAPPGRNIIGQIDGTTRADEIVIVGAHLDDYPWTGRAPGADDDGSGVSATLLLARLLAGHRTERTLRFAFFGDEENAPWVCERIGSAGYAALCKAEGDAIVAMIQADSLAFDPPESTDAIVEMNTRRPANDPDGGDLAIATAWLEAIDLYAISGLQPRIVAIGDNWSDHGSFWNNGYSAVMLIEEELDNVNPNWHTANDTVSTFAWPFYVQVVKSYLAVTAHLAGIDDVTIDTGGGPQDTDEAGGRLSCGCEATQPAALTLLLALLGIGVVRHRPRPGVHPVTREVPRGLCPRPGERRPAMGTTAGGFREDPTRAPQTPAWPRRRALGSR